MAKGRYVSGDRLRVGDTITVWWTPQRDTIIDLKPYHGPLASLFPQGAQLATFAILKTGMTINNAERYDRIASARRRIPHRQRTA